MKRADKMPLETRIPWSQWAIEARIMVAQGDRAGAIRAYKKILAPVSFRLLPQSLGEGFKIPYYYELARLEEESGQLAEAREHYNAYLERWGQSDAHIPNVDDARERLAKLDAQL